MSRWEWGLSNVGCETKSLSSSLCYQLLTSSLTEQKKSRIESRKPNYSVCTLKQRWFFYVQFSPKSREDMNLCFGQSTNGISDVINSIFQHTMERGMQIFLGSPITRQSRISTSDQRKLPRPKSPQSHLTKFPWTKCCRKQILNTWLE